MPWRRSTSRPPERKSTDRRCCQDATPEGKKRVLRVKSVDKAFSPCASFRCRAVRAGWTRELPNVITRLEDSSMAAKKGKKAAKKPAAKRSAAKKPMKRAAAKKPAAKSKSKRKPNAAFMKPMNPSSTLAAVVGNSPMPRTEVTD